jgi:tetratricopeptide (TPR) repeat protein
MKFRRVLMITALSLIGKLSAAVPPTIAEAAAEGPGKQIDVLIRELADENFRVREDATRKIWDAGEPALPALQEAANGTDPEKAFRARELIRKIQLSITPETDSEVMGLVERYAKASPNEKINLLNLMSKKRAWRQVLKLYASEKNAELRSRFQDSAREVAVKAARDCLLEGNPTSARDFLEMAPADAGGLMALAEFHRSQGTLDAELKRAQAVKGRNSEAWTLALQRAAGDLEAARDAATAAGETRISAAMSVMLGDPLPWLRADQQDGRDGAARKLYTALAIKRWQGKEIRTTELEALTRVVGNHNESERQSAINALFLLGETGLAEAALQKNSAFGAFKYFESLERIPDALKALNLDPEKPDFVTWVAKRIEHLGKDDSDDEHDASEETEQLVTMANFLERRGLTAEADTAYIKPLLDLAKKDVGAFSSFMRRLFGDQDSTSGAPLLAKKIGFQWAGDDAARWAELVTDGFGEEEEPAVWWGWLPELDPAASREGRFDAMLALFDIGADPQKLRARWLDLAWGAIKRAPQEKRAELIKRISFLSTALSAKSGNVEQGLKAWDELPESNRGEIFWGAHIQNLSASERWDEAGAIFLKQIARIRDLKQEARPDCYAYVAACLRQAGHPAEAVAYDTWADKLALGSTESSILIGQAYAYGRDYKRAEEWWNRGIRECDPESSEFATGLQLISDSLLENGQWKQAAAVSEITAQTYATSEYSGLPPIALLRERMQADMGRALANLKNDRAGSITLLEKCHRLFPGDGTLADSFFPALRKAGLMEEHNRWFGISWDLLADVIRQYPASENTYNTAGWLASRARLKLDLADNFLQKALAMNPAQSAYLDTMAEIQFARGNRAKALEWSQLAVNFSPQDSQIRRQHERFRSDPIPR